MKNLLIAALFLPALVLAAPDNPGAGIQEQAQWRAWHQRSTELRRLDREAMARELEVSGNSEPVVINRSKDFGLDLSRPAEYYKSEEGRRIADIVLSYQTPSGGWSKRVDMTQRPRRLGETFGPGKKGYQPTFDNRATSTQMQVLAKAFAGTGDTRYRDSFLRGLELILQAQMPNGGWPQSFPLDGGYHDLMTYNDKSTVCLLELLLAIAQEQPGFTFIPKEQQQRVRESLQRGIDGILQTQVRLNGRNTIWGAQHDPITLQPVAARAFEPVALATAESAEILLLLMELPNPSAEVIRSIKSAMDWFRAHRIDGQRWDQPNGLVPDPKAKPLWARFYDLETQRPVFGDRDGQVHTALAKVSLERRLGYAWYTTTPAKLEKHFRKWKQRIDASE